MIKACHGIAILLVLHASRFGLPFLQTELGEAIYFMVKFSAILPLALVTIVAGCATIPQPGQMTVANEQAENGVAPRQDREKPGEHLLQIASDVEARGDKESALQFYERAATMSEDPITRVKLGDAYMRAGRPEEAASAYRAALAQAPEDGQALMGAGGALMQAGKIQESYEALAKAAPIVKTGLAYNRVGVALVMLGRIPEAQTAFEEAHELDKVDADITDESRPRRSAQRPT